MGRKCIEGNRGRRRGGGGGGGLEEVEGGGDGRDLAHPKILAWRPYVSQFRPTWKQQSIAFALDFIVSGVRRRATDLRRT